jgi:hypothetical protein
MRMTSGRFAPDVRHLDLPELITVASAKDAFGEWIIIGEFSAVDLVNY